MMPTGQQKRKVAGLAGATTNLPLSTRLPETLIAQSLVSIPLSHFTWVTIGNGRPHYSRFADPVQTNDPRGYRLAHVLHYLQGEARVAWVDQPKDQ